MTFNPHQSIGGLVRYILALIREHYILLCVDNPLVCPVEQLVFVFLNFLHVVLGIYYVEVLEALFIVVSFVLINKLLNILMNILKQLLYSFGTLNKLR
jgi:hypothetical protein